MDGIVQSDTVLRSGGDLEQVTQERLGGDAKLCNKEVMKSFCILSLAVFLVCCPAQVSTAQQRAADGAKIIGLEKQWTDAYKHRDIAILSSLLAEDFVITVEDGSTYGKAGYISHSADSSVRVDMAELSELRVRMHGNTAVVTGAYHEKGDSKGKPYEYRDRLTDVWMKTGGGWQVIASHYSVPLTQ
jgi:ketosteroid isomerase-like protein